MSERSDLIDEANALGLEFKKNIATKKLKVMVAEAKGEPAPLDEAPPPSPRVKKPESAKSNAEKDNDYLRSVHARKRQKIQKAKERAFATRIITLTNKDPRDNEMTTTAYLSFENQHFGLSKVVPLDIPVELEQALIDIAESTMITLHKDEIVDGRRTGNKVPVPTKKYVVSYAK